MKMPVRILLLLLCAALIVCMPFFLSSPTLLYEAEMEFYDEEEDEEEDDSSLDFGRLFFSSAVAEEEPETGQFTTDDIEIEDLTRLSIPDAWALPLDFGVPPLPDPDRFTEDGYEDKSIRVRHEVRETEKYNIHIAYVEVASATQLRTATAYGRWDRAMYMDTMAESCNAVIAMNGDLFIELPEKKKFEYRMTQIVAKKRNKPNKLKDTLIIDKNGDFHLFLLSDGLVEYRDTHGDEIVNAFMFGPALVVDGELREPAEDYAYHPKGHEPRSAIGQTGPLNYVMVVIEARVKDEGITHMQLAELMLELGCVQAYNLDGGNTAEMIIPGPDPAHPLLHVKGRPDADFRTQSDIIYFATAVPEEDRD